MNGQAGQSQLLHDGGLDVAPRTGHVRSMIPPFEVFQTEADGNVLWRGTAATMEDAKARIRELAAENPGEFIVMSRRTGQKLIVQCNEFGPIAESTNRDN